MEYVRQALERVGYRETADGQPADLYIVNTCTVTAKADHKSRKAIRQFARENPHARIVVMGCYATWAPEEVAALDGVTDVLTDKRRLPELLARFGLPEVPTGISSFGRRHRAFVKVQDGCRMSCSYCIIPKCRSVLVSRPPGDVLAEIGRLVDHGHREIVLTGIHLGHYGVDLAGGESGDERVDLAALVRRIVRLDGDFRVRISSIEAAEVTPKLVALVTDHPDRICPHLHLSMQSGSDRVLERMRRRYTSRQFIEQCRQVHESLDRPALTTDVIVGFPGESESDFEATCRAVEEAGFSKIHVFSFSPRRGTPAAEMPDQIPGGIKRRRAAELARIGKRLRERFFESLAGRPLRVLVESTVAGRQGRLLGTSARYVPVELPGAEDRIGQFVGVLAGPVVEGRIRAADAPDCVEASGVS